MNLLSFLHFWNVDSILMLEIHKSSAIKLLENLNSKIHKIKWEKIDGGERWGEGKGKDPNAIFNGRKTDVLKPLNSYVTLAPCII